MKYFLQGLFLIAFTPCFSQGSKSLNTFATTAAAGAAVNLDISNMPTFGLYGIGNTNTETFNNLNASGKLSGYIRPYKGTDHIFCKSATGWQRNGYLELDFAYNLNASNTDSLIASTFLFPDVGQTSFLASAQYSYAIMNGANNYLITPFVEFSDKTIKGRRNDSTRSFYTLNTVYGLNLQFLNVNGSDKVSFLISLYGSSISVPDPGTQNYKYLFTGSDATALKTRVASWGVKVAFQYNNFQIFADFRTVKGNKADFPVEGLTGFHPNLGVTFNAEIFER